MNGSIYIVGIGPGSRAMMSSAAINAISSANIVAGYTTYIELIKDLCEGKKIFSTSMMAEVERADYAITAAAAGNRVAVIASGDAGVYGLGGLVLEQIAKRTDPWHLASNHTESKTTADQAATAEGIRVEIIPGVTAANAAASLLGAPLMNDYLVLSLSDLLTDVNLIRRRLQAAADGDFVVALYNPRSATRTTLIQEARSKLLEQRLASCPVGIVRNAYRTNQNVFITTLGELDKHFETIDMFSIVIIGNSMTELFDSCMVTPRGYNQKSN